MENWSRRIEDNVEDGSLTIGVVGLGYVGLPLALAFSKKFEVVGFDTVTEKIDMLRQGRSYIDDIREFNAPRFHPTTELAKLAECDVIIVCVPTPLHENKRPDLGPVKDASSEIGKILRRGQLIILESTTYPGTTEEIVVPILERESGLKVLKDFGVAYSPERIDPGNKQFTVETTPKVVGGLTPEWTRATAKVYGSIIARVVEVTDCKTAELVKVYENIFRNVNIALVNEMALICERMGINVWEVIDAAKSKPYGFMAFYPGPGVGGHCIPLDPYYLAYRARQFNYIPQFIETAGEVNDYMPIHVCNLTRLGLAKVNMKIHGAKVAVLGISYKPDVSDTRESPAANVIDELIEEGAEVKIYDPLAKVICTKCGKVCSESSIDDVLRWADVAILVTPHALLKKELASKLKGIGSSLVLVDTRGALADAVKDFKGAYIQLGNQHS